MSRRPISNLRLAAVAAIVGALPVASADAQSSAQPKWTLAAGLTTIRVGPAGAWGYGPELSIRREVGQRGGVGLRVSLPVMGTDAGGAAIDLGPTLTLTGRQTELGASVGGTAFLVGDDSELVAGGVGVFGAVHLTLWLGRHVGLTAAANGRYASGSAIPSVSGGLAVRF